jgi:ABC-2 type transport system permease protein
MSYTAFQALVRRDLRLFFMDRRAVTMSFIAPIAIASFFGYIFGGVTQNSSPSKIGVAVVNQDDNEISRKVVAALAADAALDVKSPTLSEARELVRGGKTTVAAVIPAGFAERAARSFFRSGDKPEIQLLYDPSHATELQVVRGVLTQHVMEVVSREAMGGPSSQRLVDDALRDLAKSGLKTADQAALRRMLQGVGEWNQRQNANPQAQASSGFSMPYTVSQEAVTARQGVKYNSMAHSFAGMCVQFILFMGIDAGMVVLNQRRTGLWKRLQAAPLSRYTMIGSRAASAAIVAMIIMCTVFGFARIVFGVKIEGSFTGFLGVCVAFAIMTATFGLLVAVLG